jgi:hypothetical protein
MNETRELQPASVRRPTAESCSAGRPGAAVPTWFVGATRLLLCTLREIFDESAYSRFLARHGVASCPSAYAGFLREQEVIKARRPKCC